MVGSDVVLAKGFGERDVANEKAVTADTLFAIGSSTKAFTTLALATLVDEGRLDWDGRVVDYMPSFRLSDADRTMAMTPRDLVTHRSGLPRHDLVWYGSDLSRAELVERLRYLDANQDLRQGFQYQNMMYMTAGRLGEVITAKTWEEMVRERIFEPLGMNNSNFSVQDTQAAEVVQQIRQAGVVQ